MSYCFSGINRVEQHHNPEEGRNIWNNNFDAVQCALAWVASANTGSTVIVSTDDNILASLSGLSVPYIYEISLNNNIIVSSISADTIYSGSTNIYDIFIGNNIWSSSTGSNSIIANNGSGNFTSGEDSFVIGKNNLLTGKRSAILGGQNITGSADDTIYIPRLEIKRTDVAPINLPILDSSFSSSTHGDFWISTGATTLLNVVIGNETKSIEL